MCVSVDLSYNSGFNKMVGGDDKNGRGGRGKITEMVGGDEQNLGHK